MPAPDPIGASVEPFAAAAVLAVLGGIWAAATRRHERRRATRDADWSGDGIRPDVWTSQARCPHCTAAGGVLAQEGDGLRFTCLACGRTHRRREPG